jgi:hypothetical protein
MRQNGSHVLVPWERAFVGSSVPLLLSVAWMLNDVLFSSLSLLWVLHETPLLDLKLRKTFVTRCSPVSERVPANLSPPAL